MAKKDVNFYLIKQEKGTTYKNPYANEIDISNVNSQINTYFNIDVQQSAYFTMMIDGFEYGRFHTQIQASTPGGTSLLKHNNGRRDYTFVNDPKPVVDGAGNLGDGSVMRDSEYGKLTFRDTIEPYLENNTKYNGWQNFTGNDGRRTGRRTEHWLPLKSLQFSNGSIEALSLAAGTFSDLRLPFRKQSPTLTVEMYDHRSDVFEMMLKEWHSESVLTSGFVPVLESITKTVTIRGFSTNGDINYETTCECILIDDITTSRDYSTNDLKVISFKLLVVGY